jgi:hypothetical protein
MKHARSSPVATHRTSHSGAMRFEQAAMNRAMHLRCDAATTSGARCQ